MVRSEIAEEFFRELDKVFVRGVDGEGEWAGTEQAARIRVHSADRHDEIVPTLSFGARFATVVRIDVVYRRRAVPERSVGLNVVVAHPHNDLALLLSPTTALIWKATKDWASVDELDRVLSERHSDVEPSDRRRALNEAIALLQKEGLLEQRPA